MQPSPASLPSLLNLLAYTGLTPTRVIASALIVAMAGMVAIDHGRRLKHARRLVGVLWAVAAALALGTGLWSAYLIQLDAQAPGLRVDGERVVLAWLSGSLLTALAVALMPWQDTSGRRMLLAASALTAAIVSQQHWLTAVPQALRSLWLPTAIAWFGALGCVLGLRVSLIERSRSSVWRVLAATLLGVATAASHVAAGRPDLGDGASGSLPIASLGLLSTVGTFTLLAVMWAGLTLGGRMHASLRRSEQQLRAQSDIDRLTGLPTRAVMEANLDNTAREADADRTSFALLVIDVDGFKPINENFGHRYGDQVLQEMARRLQAHIGPGDRLARMGADVFLLLLARTARPDDARRAASALITALSRPCQVEGRESTLTCSIGIAMYPAHGGMSTLITHADLAMRAAKQAGGATHAMFETRMVDGPREQADLLRDLREALGRGQMELYYQPKIHGPSGEITGVEALMRWHHPQRGMVSPVVFIPLAERFGLIDALGAWLIDEACRQAAEWRDQGLRMRIAINLSARQLSNPLLADQISSALLRHQVNPMLLTCEITESVAMEEGEATMKVFERLAATGVHIAIDDFGTGYSSLAYLRKLPARELKIDRSFVLDLATSSDARAVVDAVIKLAQALGLKVVAEGVETEQQSRILSELGCDELQGFLFARPMSSSALSLWATGEGDGPQALAFRASLFHETQSATIP